MKKWLESLVCEWWQSFERYTSLNRLPLLSFLLLNPIHYIFQLVCMMVPHLICCIFKPHLYLTGYVMWFKLMQWARPLPKRFSSSAWLINMSSAFYYGTANKRSQRFFFRCCCFFKKKKKSVKWHWMLDIISSSLYIFTLLRFRIVKTEKVQAVILWEKILVAPQQFNCLFFFLFKYFPALFPIPTHISKTTISASHFTHLLEQSFSKCGPQTSNISQHSLENS